MTQEPPSGQDRQRTPVIVFVSESVIEHQQIQQILSGSVWNVCCLRTCREAIEAVFRERTPVVVCERKLRDGYWTDVFDATGVFEPRPEIIVTSRTADERLWAEVLNLGGSDVLGQPFDTREVVASVSAAWWRWNNRLYAPGRHTARAGGS